MGRRKVKFAFISNDSQRKATYKKRKGGIIKKVTELSTLCDVKTCAIIYSPYDATPEVWPSIEDARKIALEFKALPEIDQSKKMMDHQAYLKQRITKIDEQTRKLKKYSKELEMIEVLSQSFMGNLSHYNMNITELNDLCYLIDHFYKNVMRNIEIQHKSGMEIGESSNAAATPEGISSTMVMTSTPMAPIQEVTGSSSSSYADFYRQQQPQFQYSPYVRQPQNLNLSLNHNQNQWFVEMTMNQLAQPSNAVEQPQPHQPTTGDSTLSAAVPSPATYPNFPASNIWFR